MKQTERKFQGIWIPSEIWLSQELTLQEKVFYVEIDSLDCSEKGCFANNNYFAKFFGVSTTRVSLVIKSLIEKGFITSQINVKEGNKRMLKTSLTKVKDPLQQKLKHNNTISNTINNPVKERKISKKKFIPPTLDEVKEYFKEKGYSEEAAKRAFDYYEAGGWKDSTGKPVKSWKQKMIAVWFKPQNLQEKNQQKEIFNPDNY